MLHMLQLAVERSTRRGEEIKSVLLDEDLSTTMIERLQERTGGQSSCVQMFLCKISPVISVVQRSSAEAISGMMVNSLEDTRSETGNMYFLGWFQYVHYSNLLLERVQQQFPDTEQFEKNSRDCEDKYQTCKLLQFNTN